MTDEIGYADAMRELDDILEELERDDLDVDVLAVRVQRASELIQLCRGRIARAQADVDRVVTDLESLERTDATVLARTVLAPLTVRAWRVVRATNAGR